MTEPTSHGTAANTTRITTPTTSRVPGCSRVMVRMVSLAARPRLPQNHDAPHVAANTIAAPIHVRPPVILL